jgi:hypothetical protein
VDPEDDRTFWFTGQYQPADAVWGTRIAAFKIQRDTYDVTPVALLTPIPSANFTSTESVSTRLLNAGLEPASGLQVSLYLDNVLITTDNVTGSIPVGGFLDHTFTQTVALTQVAKDYRFRIISAWQYDTYAKNDTFNQTVRYLTSQDAACAGRANFPGLICGSTFNLEFVLKNAGAQALQSANIQWNINADPVQILAWAGNLPPGASDTISLPVTGVGEGVNFFYANVFQPNGVADQDIHNDSLFFKFFGNLDGAYVAAYSNTNYGVLDVELRRFSNNQLLLAREFPPNSATTYYMCTDDNTCYKLVLFSSTLAWEGHFILFDIFGDTLVQTTSVDTDGETFTFCTPIRKPKDVGAWALTSPQSYEGMSSAETVKMEFRNFGLNDQTNIQLSYRMNGGVWHTESYTGTVKPTETISFTFSTTEDLSTFNTDYLFEYKATVNGDELPQNDLKTTIVSNRGNTDAAIISLSPFVACNNAEGVVLKALIKNEGLKFLDTAQMLYTVNGLPQTAIDVPCSLAPGASFDFYLNPQGLTLGANEILLDLSNVDGSGEDQNPLNDSLRTTVFIDPDKIQASVSVFTDDKPSETSWQLLKGNGQLLAEGGPYSEDGWLYFSALCLDKEDCYTFRLKDAGGDGMNGFVQIEADGLVLGTFFGGNFGDSLDIPVCVVDTKNIEQEESPLLFPNPSAGMVWLSLPVEAQRNHAEAYLLDPSGKCLQVLRLHRWNDRLKGGFSLEKYPAGTYTIRVQAGKSSRMLRVVKQ